VNVPRIDEDWSTEKRQREKAENLAGENWLANAKPYLPVLLVLVVFHCVEHNGSLGQIQYEKRSQTT
jgi:hypothetical protein